MHMHNKSTTETARQYKMWCSDEAVVAAKNPYYQIGGVNGPMVPEWAYEECYSDEEFAKNFCIIIAHPRTKNRMAYMRRLLHHDDDESRIISKAEIAYYDHLVTGADLSGEILEWQYEVAFLYHFPTAMAISPKSQPMAGIGVAGIASATSGVSEGIYAQEGALSEIRKSLEHALVIAGKKSLVYDISDIDAQEFERRVMKDFPDYFGVLVQMGLPPDGIPLDIGKLPKKLATAYVRAAIRVELSLTARRMKTDLVYANQMFDKKYTKKNKALPYIPQPKELIGDSEQELIDAEMNAMLPGWLPPADELAPEGEALKNSTKLEEVIADKKNNKKL